MGGFIAFVLGLFTGAIVCLLGVALVFAGERLEYSDGYAQGYIDGKEDK